MPRVKEAERVRELNHTLVCQWCGREFRAHRSDTRWCSKACEWKPESRLPAIELPRPNSHDLAWAAGFFDGEGCFTARKSAGNGRRYLALQLVQKQPTELIDKFAQMFAAGRIYRWEKRGSQYLSYSAHGRQAFYIADLLWPWLGERKRADFKRVLRECASFGPPKQGTRGRRYVYAKA